MQNEAKQQNQTNEKQNETYITSNFTNSTYQILRDFIMHVAPKLHLGPSNMSFIQKIIKHKSEILIKKIALTFFRNISPSHTYRFIMNRIHY